MIRKPAYTYLWKRSDISYGRLYNGYAVLTGKLAPVGYVVPTDAQWTTLTDYINTNYNQAPNDFGVGNHLKSQRQDPTGNTNVIIQTTTQPCWNADATHYGRDSVKFSALPGGQRSSFNGGFILIGTAPRWWSLTPYSTGLFWREMNHNASTVVRSWSSGKQGLTVKFMRAASTFEQSQFADGAFVGQVHDLCGNVYDLVKIGTQVWSVQNLACMRYNDGTAIPLVTDNAAWMALETGAYCNYNNDAVNVLLGSTVNDIWITLKRRA